MVFMFDQNTIRVRNYMYYLCCRSGNKYRYKGKIDVCYKEVAEYTCMVLSALGILRNLGLSWECLCRGKAGIVMRFILAYSLIVY